MFRSQSLDEFLTELSSRNPTPGGGTAAGYAAAMGTALVEMVANVVGARDEEERHRLGPFVESCDEFRTEFLAMMDEDSRSFETYMAALHLPKSTDEEKTARRKAMQGALESSTRAPLRLATRICDFADLFGAVLGEAPKDIASDLYVGASMLEAGYEGATANVYVNLAYLKEPFFIDETLSAIQQCRQRIRRLDSIKERVGELLGIS